jgi:SAM-dependent methyltransferase
MRRLKEVPFEQIPRHLVAKVARHLTALAARLAFLPVSRPTSKDPYHLLFRRFIANMNALTAPTVVEIGSRARSGNVYTAGFRSDTRYTGVDIIAGENVHLVADAHDLSAHLQADSFDGAFSISVFEHLAMPWKVAVELNRVLKTGGLVFVATHPTWPPHEKPWDFYRFTQYGLSALFNKTSGFEIVDVCEGLPCRIVPLGFEPPMRRMAVHDAFLGVAILARKIGPADSRLNWNVSLREFLATNYPTE